MSTRDHTTTSPSIAPDGESTRLPRLLQALWAGRWWGWAGAAAVAVGFAALAAWWTPRGPVTATQALATMLISIGVGGLAGLLARSRWAMLLVPALFVFVFEAARVGADGPTVDGLHVDSVYGLVAFFSGRGFHGVLALVPMVLGAALGAALARRLQGRAAGQANRSRTVGSYVRTVVAAIVALALVALAVLIARPASTAAIVGADGTAVPGSIAELTTAEVNGHDLSMMIRGTDVANPVLLFLAGGPGGSEFGAMSRYGHDLENDFVVVTLDQRGTGTSYPQLEPTETMTVPNAVNDVLGTTGYLRERFGQDQIYLVGQSWGTFLGVLSVQARPEWYQAFVGVGQMVDPLETDRIFYEDTLTWAQDTGNTDLAQQLQQIGAPPYEDLLNYPTVLGYEQQVYPYDHSVNAEGAGQMTASLPAGEYSLLDTVNLARGLLDSFALLYPQLQDLDFRTDVPTLEVPVYLAEGRYEARGRSQPAREWFDLLQAPSKQWIQFDTSGHRPLFEQPEQFAELMSGTVLGQATDPT